MKLKHDKLRSNFAFNCNLRQYPSGAEVATLGLPASPEEARAFLVRTNADTVPHGDHVDFVVGNRLIHIVTGGEASGHCGTDCGHVSDCGTDCGSSLHHAAGNAMMVDHGQLNITRRRIGGAADPQAKATPSSSSASSSSSAPAARAAPIGIGGGRYLPHVKPSSPTMESSSSSPSAAASEALTSVDAVYLAVNMEHEGGAEVGLGRKCSKCPSTHLKPPILELNSII